MISYIENAKESQKIKADGIKACSKVQNPKSIYKKQLYFYILAMNNHEVKLRKQFILQLHQ